MGSTRSKPTVVPPKHQPVSPNELLTEIHHKKVAPRTTGPAISTDQDLAALEQIDKSKDN